ncbi:hypothetical protein FA15DRAFT_672155 [Coprinopsis marcescibilis]|uniref:Uncharacterized protein n=1 Tax=Coprinopsis marcescibilis TaxID=230819 RepID=A0A5C3L0Z8_COPMA|nr:hypothetical protein FA15DRAFT_672155 [Coprinopsis marcescibilis]
MSNKPITRETFIDPGYETVAATRTDMMFVLDGEDSVKKVPVPESVKESGKIPDGYAVDFLVEPLTLVVSFRKNGHTLEGQLPEGLIDDLKKEINGPTNLMITPTSVRDSKFQMLLEHHKKDLEDL